MTETVKTTFGDELRRIRNKLKQASQDKCRYTQQGVALSCDMSPRFYQYLENGERTPSLITIFRLADALETTPQKITEKAWKEWKRTKKA